MKRSAWLSTGSIAILAMAPVFARAQDTPPTDNKTTEGQDPEVETPAPKRNWITVAYTSLKPHAEMSRYARPTEGLSLSELKLFTYGEDHTHYGSLTLRGAPKQDAYYDHYISFNRGHTVVRGSHKDYGYFAADFRPAGKSVARESEITVEHEFTPQIGGFFTYATTEKTDRYPAPRDEEKSRTRFYAGGVQGQVLGGTLGVTASERRIYDDKGARPETLFRKIEGSYGVDLGQFLSLEGVAGYTRIEQSGLANAGVRNYALAGAFNLGPDTSMQFHFARTDLSLANVQNTYDRKRFLSSARLIHRWPKWSFQFGYKYQSTERLRTDQSFVDVPKTNEYDARLSGRIGSARVTLRGSWQDLRQTAVMNTLDTRQMFWDDRIMFQAKADMGNEKYTAYGTFTHKFEQNKQRGVEIRWTGFSFGGTYLFNDSLNGFAEVSFDQYKAEAGDGIGSGLDFYFPDSRSGAVGLNWANTDGFSASASINFFDSANVRGSQLMLSLRKQLGLNNSLELMVAPWRFDDKLYDRSGYRSTLLMLKYSLRF